MEKALQRDQARELFLQTELSNTQIAELLDVDRKTVSRWIKEDQWREMKSAAMQAPGAVLLELYDQLTALNKNINSREPHLRFPTRDEALIQRRILLSIKSIDRQNAGNYMQTYSELIEELQHYDKEIAKLITRHADSIIRRKVKRDERFNAQQFMFIDDDIDNAQNTHDSQSHVTARRNDEAASQQQELISFPPGSESRVTARRNDEAVSQQQELVSFPYPGVPSAAQWDIQKNTITQQDQPFAKDLSTSMPQKNVSADGTLANEIHTSPSPSMERGKGGEVTPTKPTIKYNGGWLDWLGEGTVRDYEENTARRITTDEWNAFLRTGYKLSELDNYNYIPDPAYDEERKKLVEERTAAYLKQREKIDRFVLSMKNEYNRNSSRASRW